ncbi:hypothetical protein D4764_03G0001430 [Takifugu flavidus]|uniref:Uncharacterized protein n=1 Tax=Takifugu flavidus TaxID=433684 RepID=A0A5C6N7P0_9TELE|nr:hypothetical protein D4764_03G0001430 [Takifugu flavidus]
MAALVFRAPAAAVTWPRGGSRRGEDAVLLQETLSPCPNLKQVAARIHACCVDHLCDLSEGGLGSLVWFSV